jgi:hypothetical protein
MNALHAALTSGGVALRPGAGAPSRVVPPVRSRAPVRLERLGDRSASSATTRACLVALRKKLDYRPPPAGRRLSLGTP